jgi:excisionase family DNA binding protein
MSDHTQIKIVPRHDGGHTPDYLTPKEAAQILRTTPGTLEVWRRTGSQDLNFYRRGRNILYDRAELDAFMRRLKVQRSSN